jgi:hypothetical protein
MIPGASQSFQLLQIPCPIAGLKNSNLDLSYFKYFTTGYTFATIFKDSEKFIRLAFITPNFNSF